jgi:type II thyroxine 5'-deiodinase
VFNVILSFCFHHQVKLGEDAPNSSVVHVSSPEGGISSGNGAPEKTADGAECHLLDFAHAERPLVVNFGSAT